MTPEVVSREQWGALPAKSVPGGFTSLVATVGHYTGAGRPFAQADHRQCYEQVRGIQKLHQAIANQSDIEYNHLGCQHGVIFQGRMAGVRGGANGTADSNATMPSFCFLMGIDEQPTEALYDAAAWWHAQIELKAGAWLTMFGHRDEFKTTCPGDIIYDWILDDGYHPPPVPQPPEGDDMLIRQVWKGYHNRFLMGAGGAEHLTEQTDKHFEKQGVPLITNEPHQQSLKSALFQAGLDSDDLVPDGTIPPWYAED